MWLGKASYKMAFEYTPEGRGLKPWVYLGNEHSREMSSMHSSTEVGDYLVCLGEQPGGQRC